MVRSYETTGRRADWPIALRPKRPLVGGLRVRSKQVDDAGSTAQPPTPES